jgi:hypothetical protein
MPQTKEQHRIYMQNRRKDKKDVITRQIEEQSKKVKEQSIKQQFKKRRELTPVDDAWGREPQLTQEKQYEHDPADSLSSLGANAWGEDSSQQQPKKPSLQSKLKDLFPEYSE